MSWKYIILRTGNREVPIIFPDHLVHAQVADAIRGMYGQIAVEMSNGVIPMGSPAIQRLMDDIEPVAAGELTIDIGSASGRSETLGVESRPTDAKFLRSYSYHHGIMMDAEAEPSEPSIHTPCLLCTKFFARGKRAHKFVRVGDGFCHPSCLKAFQAGDPVQCRRFVCEIKR